MFYNDCPYSIIKWQYFKLKCKKFKKKLEIFEMEGKESLFKLTYLELLLIFPFWHAHFHIHTKGFITSK